MTSAVTVANVARHDDPDSVRAYTREASLWPIEHALIEEFMPAPPARLLDIGCGGGRTTVPLADAGYEVAAIDLSGPLLAAAHRRHPGLPLAQMDAAALGFDSGAFDAALFSFNGIDYIYPESARVSCLAEVFRVLRPGGIFILSSHNLIGHLWSGGYWYLRGYLNAARLLSRQRGNPHIREWYARYGDEQVHYSAPPTRTVSQLQDAGFEPLAVRGASGERNPANIRMHQAHVYFVAKKPVSVAP